jgi:hypothetical protein
MRVAPLLMIFLPASTELAKPLSKNCAVTYRRDIDGVASVPSVPRVGTAEQHVLLALPPPRVDPNCAHGERRTTVLEPFPTKLGSRACAKLRGLRISEKTQDFSRP